MLIYGAKAEKEITREQHLANGIIVVEEWQGVLTSVSLYLCK